MSALDWVCPEVQVSAFMSSVEVCVKGESTRFAFCLTAETAIELAKMLVIEAETLKRFKTDNEVNTNEG